MYTAEERSSLRDALVAAARADARVAGAALTGSAAVDAENDDWLLFGSPVEQQPAWSVPEPLDLVGLGWLYALHARSSIARGKGWQAEYMISGVRDHVLMLACLRFGVPHSQGRGLHLLPEATTAAVEATLVRSLESTELLRAFGASVDVLLSEIAEVDAELAVRLAGPLRELTTA
jgi:hypothetical protein